MVHWLSPFCALMQFVQLLSKFKHSSPLCSTIFLNNFSQTFSRALNPNEPYELSHCIHTANIHSFKWLEENIPAGLLSQLISAAGAQRTHSAWFQKSSSFLCSLLWGISYISWWHSVCTWPKPSFCPALLCLRFISVITLTENVLTLNNVNEALLSPIPTKSHGRGAWTVLVISN